MAIHGVFNESTLGTVVPIATTTIAPATTDSGKTWRITDASEVNVSLPSVGVGDIGITYTFAKGTGSIVINPADSDVIQLDGISSILGLKNATTDLDCITIKLVEADKWVVLSLTGTWFDYAAAFNVEYEVIAGGGGSGSSAGGGGGAGGYRHATGFSVNAETNYTVTIGAGGAGGATGGNNNGVVGSDSVFATITSKGGGYGAAVGSNGGTGGSGGGGAGANGSTGGAESETPNQGNNGGNGGQEPDRCGGGGGGQSAVGANTIATNLAGAGGAGLACVIDSVDRCGGGGGGGNATITTGTATHGGGTGGDSDTPHTAGAANTGGGAGGAGVDGASFAGKAGGSGAVLLKYPDAYTISNPGGGLSVSAETSGGGYKYVLITAGTGNVSWS